jgi:hypothetical protein
LPLGPKFKRKKNLPFNQTQSGNEHDQIKQPNFSKLAEAWDRWQQVKKQGAFLLCAQKEARGEKCCTDVD